MESYCSTALGIRRLAQNPIDHENTIVVKHTTWIAANVAKLPELGCPLRSFFPITDCGITHLARSREVRHVYGHETSSYRARQFSLVCHAWVRAGHWRHSRSPSHLRKPSVRVCDIRSRPLTFLRLPSAQKAPKRDADHGCTCPVLANHPTSRARTRIIRGDGHEKEVDP